MQTLRGVQHVGSRSALITTTILIFLASSYTIFQRHRSQLSCYPKWGLRPLKAWLPDGHSQNFRFYAFGPLGFWTMALLRYTAKFIPFLSLVCVAPPSPTLHLDAIQGKEGKKVCHLATLPQGPQPDGVSARRVRFQDGS